MRVSEGVEWGLHCAVLLAALPGGVTLPGSALAAFHGVSESYLLKHLKAMAQAGTLESLPGPKGGYRLAKPAAEITVLDVVDAIEGAAAAFRCTEIRRRGPAGLEDAAYRLPCAINRTMLSADQAWRATLRARTLADLVETVAAELDPRAVSAAFAWLEEHVRS